MLSGGVELSRRQLQIWEDAMSDENAGSKEKMEHIPEDEVDDSNCESDDDDQLLGNLQRIPEPIENADNDTFDQEIAMELRPVDSQENIYTVAAPDTEDADNGNKKEVEVPSESAEAPAESTQKTDCLNGENHNQSR